MSAILLSLEDVDVAVAEEEDDDDVFEDAPEVVDGLSVSVALAEGWEPPVLLEAAPADEGEEAVPDVMLVAADVMPFEARLSRGDGIALVP